MSSTDCTEQGHESQHHNVHPEPSLQDTAPRAQPHSPDVQEPAVPLPPAPQRTPVHPQTPCHESSPRCPEMSLTFCQDHAMQRKEVTVLPTEGNGTPPCPPPPPPQGGDITHPRWWQPMGTGWGHPQLISPTSPTLPAPGCSHLAGSQQPHQLLGDGVPVLLHKPITLILHLAGNSTALPWDFPSPTCCRALGTTALGARAAQGTRVALLPCLQSGTQ